MCARLRVSTTVAQEKSVGEALSAKDTWYVRNSLARYVYQVATYATAKNRPRTEIVHVRVPISRNSLSDATVDVDV
eukprot:1542545-Prymnesium_polylepis.2